MIRFYNKLTNFIVSLNIIYVYYLLKKYYIQYVNSLIIQYQKNTRQTKMCQLQSVILILKYFRVKN